MKDNSRKTRFWTVLVTVNSLTLLLPIVFLIAYLRQADDDPLRLLAILATYGTVFLLFIADTVSICCRYFMES
jgi:RsiW-degrading membrane proteinase PrsW (M82 family)